MPFTRWGIAFARDDAYVDYRCSRKLDPFVCEHRPDEGFRLSEFGIIRGESALTL
jgi:hypothetical protein